MERFILVIALAITAFGIVWYKHTQKRKKLHLQRRKDGSIEKDALTLEVKQLLLHSKHSVLIYEMVKTIKERMDSGASPAEMTILYTRLGILNKIDPLTVSSPEEEFSYELQKALYEGIDHLDAFRWRKQASQNTENEDWENLRGTTLFTFKRCPYYMDII